MWLVVCLVTQSHPALCNRKDTCQIPLSMEFPRQAYWSGLPFPSPGDLHDLRSNSGFLHCSQILHHMSHQGSPHGWLGIYIYVSPVGPKLKTGLQELGKLSVINQVLTFQGSLLQG